MGLAIKDGDPPQWWRSTSIWTVPAGPLVEGGYYEVWAMVENDGDTVPRARVDFWWADPSATIRVNTAKVIGHSVEQDIPNGPWPVKCFSKWHVELVNGGHECLIAAVFGTPFKGPDGKIMVGSIPEQLDEDFLFDPPAHKEIAQRNVSLMVPATRAPLIKVWTFEGKEKKGSLQAEAGGALDERELAQLGLEGFLRAKRPKLTVTLRPVAGRFQRPAEGPQPRGGLDLHIPPGGSVGVEVIVEAPGLKPREYALFDVVEREGGEIVGGCAFVVVPELPGSEAGRYEVTIALPDPD